MLQSLRQIMSGSDKLGFEKKLWEAADKLRSNMDAAVYKHVVLGLIFLKYISDAFDELHEALKNNPEADEEDEDEYIAKKVFWVPKKARWNRLKANARQPEIGQIIDEAMLTIEKCNTPLKGVLPKDYARPTLDKVKLGELVDLIGDIGLGSKDNQSKDILGRVYEYFLGEFASAEGKKGGQFYTPRSVVSLLVNMLQPFKGRIYDPCCGSGGMFVQSEIFLREHGGRIGDVSIYGQESNPTTWKLAQMNLAIRGLRANLGKENADTIGRTLHPDLRADYILANPPFNMKDWGHSSTDGDVRWKYGRPPAGNANFAWVQHILHHLNEGGSAGFVLSNGSLNSSNKAELSIRSSMLDGGYVECIVALPSNLFYSTTIPACLWIIRKPAKGNYSTKKDVLMIDARDLGVMINRTRRELTQDDIEQVSSVYQKWKDDPNNVDEIDGFCNSATIEQIKAENNVIMPGRYIRPKSPENEATYRDETEAIIEELSNNSSLKSEIVSHAINSLSALGFHGTREEMLLNLANSAILNRICDSLFSSLFRQFCGHTDELDAALLRELNVSSDVFVGTIEETRIGQCPSNWTMGQIDSLCRDITDGAHYSPPESIEFTPYKIASVKDMDTDGLDYNSMKQISMNEYEKVKKMGCAADEGDILFSKDGTIGQVIPHDGDESVVFLSSIALIRPLKRTYSEYLLFLLRQPHLQHLIEGGYVSGSVLQRVILKDFKKIPVVIPPEELIEAFGELVRPIVKMIQYNHLERIRSSN